MASIPDIQFKRDDREDTRLEKLRRLSDAVQALARQLAGLQPTSNSSGGGITMTGPALLGRQTGTGAPAALTGIQASTILPTFTAAANGLVPSPGSTIGARFLRNDGTWAEIVINIDDLPLFTIADKGLTPASGAATQVHFLRDDGAWAEVDVLGQLLLVDGAGSELDADLLDGRHGTAYLPKTGLVELDFGVFPGKSDASVAIPGQLDIVATSTLRAWLCPIATADHSVMEHMIEPIRIFAADPLVGEGFTIYGFNANQLNEPSGAGTRIYGKWTVRWEWI